MSVSATTLAIATNSLFPFFHPATISPEGAFAFAVLAIQYGVQPAINKAFLDKDASKSRVVMLTELCKVFIASWALLVDPEGTALLVQEWSLRESLCVALVPAALYAVQNLLQQQGSTQLSATTFLVVGQSKVRWMYI